MIPKGTAMGGPQCDRARVEAFWRSLLNGTTSREEAHAATVPWMEGSLLVADPMTLGGLQWLHGADQAFDSDPAVVHHGLPGTYVRTREELRQAFEAWVADCRSYDRDPVAWMAAMRAQA